MDTSNRKIMIIGVVALVAIIGGLVYANNAPSKYDGFAMCLKDKGAVFYGAFWCPHCQSQKKMFGSSEKFLPYVECSSPDGQNQLQTCKDKGVTGYPTWVFADGSRESGEIELKHLAEKTGCELLK